MTTFNCKTASEKLSEVVNLQESEQTSLKINLHFHQDWSKDLIIPRCTKAKTLSRSNVARFEVNLQDVSMFVD